MFIYISSAFSLSFRNTLWTCLFIYWTFCSLWS